MRAFWVATVLVLAACGPASSSSGDAVCGDGRLELGEVCEPPNCPLTCELEAGPSCMVGRMEGSASACNARCVYEEQVACTHFDGCCPAGCAAAQDSDCAVCGNDIVEPGETCDPPGTCVTDCSDVDPCTAMVMTGTASDCNVQCANNEINQCMGGDSCCPHGCSMAGDSDCSPYFVDPYYATDYWLADLGPVPGLPVRFGPLMVDPDDHGDLIIGGNANNAEVALYRVPLLRNASGHIVGFAAPAVRWADGAYNDGGIAYHGDTLLVPRWPENELGQNRPGSTTTDKIVDLSAVGIVSSPGGIVQVPPMIPGEGQWKIVSWPGGEWYTVSLVPDGNGTFDVMTPTQSVTLDSGPTGMTYVPPGSPNFPVPTMLVSEWSTGSVATYEVDGAGDPIIATRRNFIPGLPGAIGAAIDPVTGDFLFSTFDFGGTDRVVVVRGFVPPPPID